VETQYQTQQYTTMRPVTTVENQTVDAGGYVAQQVCTPPQVSYGLAWNRAAYVQPGPLGMFGRIRGAPVVVPTVTPGTVQTQYSYRPNYITQQVAKTAYVPETQQVQVPVQVQRMQTEMVTQQVPVQTTRMQSEVVTQKVPVQRTRMEAVTQVRKVPYVVERPVTETLTRKIPVRQQRWIKEEKVRKVPIQTTRMIYETRKEPVEVRYCETEAVTRTVKRPVTRKFYIPYNETIMVPRQVVQRTPLSYYDPFSPAIASGYSSFSVPSSSSTISSSPTIVSEPETAGPSVLGESYSDKPESRMKAIIEDPERESGQQTEPESNGDETDGDLELHSPDPADEKPLPDPTIDDAKYQKAGWRIRFDSSLAHEV
jgi:hypothetical protein